MQQQKTKEKESKKISLAPLDFEEALTAILAVPPPQKEKKPASKKKSTEE